MTVNIIGVKYDSKEMDFEQLMKLYDRTLFIFNDNQTDHYSSKRGKGNAKIRIYNRFSNYSPPRSAGIPTGHYRQGYINLSQCKDDIDKSFEEIEYLLSTGNYDNIIYSIETHGNLILGSGIFVIDNEVKRYITKAILNLGINGNYYSISTTNGITGPNKITPELISYVDSMI